MRNKAVSAQAPSTSNPADTFSDMLAQAHTHTCSHSAEPKEQPARTFSSALVAMRTYSWPCATSSGSVRALAAASRAFSEPSLSACGSSPRQTPSGVSITY